MKEKHTFNTKLHLVCSTDTLRPVFNCIHFANGFAYASDTYIILKQTLELQGAFPNSEVYTLAEMLEGKAIHRQQWEDIMSFENAVVTADGVDCCNTNGAKAFFEFYEFSEETQVPNFEAILKGKRSAVQLGFIGIDPDLFARLAKAMYCPNNNYRLQFTGVASHIYVDCPEVDDQLATMMPKILEPSLFSND